ncbi:MAG: heme ABC transporter permease CcmB [Rhodothermales bacterium]|nr:heme ABC transporter permease CcmB [Rhodothermales bacterium]
MRLHSGRTSWLRATVSVFLKDTRIEWRSRFGINLLVLFVLSSVFILVFALGQDTVERNVIAALYWIVIIFAATSSLGRSFISEEEGGTVLLLQTHVPGSAVFAGKLLFNLVLILIANVLASLAFTVFINATIANWPIFVVIVVLGSSGLAGATTILAAIIARTGNGGSLLPVLLLPILMPLLLSVVHAMIAALEPGSSWNDVGNDIATLVAYAGTVVTASVLLFDFVWKD